MELTWLDPEHLDARQVAAVAAMYEGARMVDRPWRAGMTATAWDAEIRHGWDGEAPETAVTYDDRGRLTGVLEVWASHWDNLHLAGIDVVVEPRERRRGLGRRLLEAGLARVREQGRRVVTASAPPDSPGAAFLKSMGFESAYVEAMRRLNVAAVDWDRLEELAAEARPYAEGYELQRIPVPTPADRLAGIGLMAAAINDAPTGSLEIEDEVFPPERIRDYEQAQLAGGRRLYRLVACHLDSGELAGHTVAAIDAERPWWAFQHDTSVVRAHRGHRLGLLLKIGMLQWLLAEEPQIRLMDTGNAADNKHMIAVNEAIGYELLGQVAEFQRKL